MRKAERAEKKRGREGGSGRRERERDALTAGVRRGGGEDGRDLRVLALGGWVWVPVVCGRGRRRAWAGGAALSGASGRAREERSAGRQAGRQASMELEGNIRQGRAQAVHQRATSMPYAAAAAGSGAVVGKPEERGRKLDAERERKGKRWVGGREEGERCAYASLALAYCLWAGRWHG